MEGTVIIFRIFFGLNVLTRIKFKKFGKLVLHELKEKKSCIAEEAHEFQIASQYWKMLGKSDNDISINRVGDSNTRKNVIEAVTRTIQNGKKAGIGQNAANIKSNFSNSPNTPTRVTKSVFMRQFQKSAFVPNQINKIYPMLTNHIENVDNIALCAVEKYVDVPNTTEVSEAQKNLRFLSKKLDGVEYIKSDTYPKFPYIKPIYQPFNSKKVTDCSSPNSSNSELLKEKVSFDDD